MIAEDLGVAALPDIPKDGDADHGAQSWEARGAAEAHLFHRGGSRSPLHGQGPDGASVNVPQQQVLKSFLLTTEDTGRTGDDVAVMEVGSTGETPMMAEPEDKVTFSVGVAALDSGVEGIHSMQRHGELIHRTSRERRAGRVHATVVRCPRPERNLGQL